MKKYSHHEKLISVACVNILDAGVHVLAVGGCSDDLCEEKDLGMLW